jgi:RimJ/RimL family protein N-acetyltransferase
LQSNLGNKLLEVYPLKLFIRAVHVNDSGSIHNISIQDSVLPYMVWLPSLRVEQIETMLKNLGPNDHYFVAELNETVVGYVGMTQNRSARKSHVGELFVGVDSEHQGKGIGTALINKALDVADNWLFLERIELEVLETNPRAQILYERLGFIVEGRKVGAFRSSGRYVDMIFMARFRPKENLNDN